MDYLRQLGIFDPDEYSNLSVALIGCGAIGSFTGLSLAKMGLKNLSFFDFDSVEKHNIPNQFFRIDDIGKLKSEQIKEIIKEFCGKKELISNGKYKGGPIFSNIVISSTDNMDTRRTVFDNLKEGVNEYLIDARMGGQVFIVYTVDLQNKNHIKQYEKTLYSDEESSKEGCTNRSIIYNVLGVASIVCSQTRRLLLRKRIDNMICYDYENNNLISKKWKI